MVHSRGDRESAFRGGMDEQWPRAFMVREWRREWRLDDRRTARISVAGLAHRLVGHELGLEHEIGGSVDWLNFVQDRRQRAMHQRHDACGANPDRSMSGRL